MRRHTPSPVRGPRLWAAIALTALGFSTSAVAQDGRAEAAKDPFVGQDGVRRDPKGVKGISPFWENVKKGDDAYVIRDFDAAVAAYKEALSSEPKNPIGHYRLGSAYLAKDSLDEAQASWEAASRFAANQPDVRAKALFVLADLAERRRKLDGAVAGWSAYESFAQANAEVKTYPATPPERKKRIADWEKLEREYSAVKTRIAQRVADADAKNRASAE